MCDTEMLVLGTSLLIFRGYIEVVLSLKERVEREVEFNNEYKHTTLSRPEFSV